MLASPKSHSYSAVLGAKLALSCCMFLLYVVDHIVNNKSK